MPTVTATTPDAGGNLSPTAPGLSTGAAAGNSAPTAPGGSGAAAGGNLSPNAPGLSSAASGGNLSPTAPGLSRAAAGGNLAPPAPGLIQPLVSSSGTSLTVSGGTSAAADMNGFVLVEAGTDKMDANGVMAYSTDGNQTPAATGDWVFLFWSAFDAWVFEYHIDGDLYALWYSTDGSGSLPNSNPDEISDWTANGSTEASGTFVLSFGANLVLGSSTASASGNLAPSAPGLATAAAGGNLSPSAPGAIS